MRFERSASIASGSIAACVRPGNKVDSIAVRGHTQSTMTRTTRALELSLPTTAELLALGLVIVTVILILPR